jgi:hypothetical protein
VSSQAVALDSPPPPPPGPPSCPDCNPNDVNCGCGSRPGGGWTLVGSPHSMSVKDFPNSQFSCQGVTCAGNVRIRIMGIRTQNDAAGQALDTRTCFSHHFPDSVYSFRRSMRRLCHLPQRWRFMAGRWIEPGGCLVNHANWYLQTCVSVETWAGFNFTKF